MERVIAIIKFPIYAMVVILKPSDFDNLPKFLQDKARKLSNIVENLMA